MDKLEPIQTDSTVNLQTTVIKQQKYFDSYSLQVPYIYFKKPKWKYYSIKQYYF
jgi:hypothetical protein